MDIITLAVQPRAVGKKAARAARREGDVPCVLYGHHIEPVVFQVSEKSLSPLIYTDEMHVIKVELEKDSWDCIVKEISFHPVTDRPLHADFQVLQKGEKVTLTVPIRYLGTPIGQTRGGNPDYNVHELEVTCVPKDIPSFIDVDVSQIAIGKSILLNEIDLEGLEFHAPSDMVLMSVQKPRAEVTEEEEEEEELLEGEGEAAEEAGDEE